MKVRQLAPIIPGRRSAGVALAILLLGSLLISAPRSLAQGRNGGQIRSLITALNTSDSAGAKALLAPDFTLTIAGGTPVSGADAVQKLLGLPLPISIVSLTPQGSHHVNAMLQFGSSPSIAVTFTGEGGGQIGTMAITQPVGAAPAPSATPANSSTPASAALAVTTGWNLIAGPTGTTASGAASSLYTFQAGDTAYEPSPAASPLDAGVGYWAFFSAPATLTLASGSTQPVTRPLPAGQYVMVGNPFTTNASVAGADAVYTYSASGGYQAATVLSPGQGAWAFSSAGGTLTLTAAP